MHVTKCIWHVSYVNVCMTCLHVTKCMWHVSIWMCIWHASNLESVHEMPLTLKVHITQPVCQKYIWHVSVSQRIFFVAIVSYSVSDNLTRHKVKFTWLLCHKVYLIYFCVIKYILLSVMSESMLPCHKSVYLCDCYGKKYMWYASM